MNPELIQSPSRNRTEGKLTRAELDRYQRRAHDLRSAAFVHMLKSIGRVVGAVFQPLKDALDRRRAIAELQRLDQRMLKDIGIERSQIPLIAEQLIQRRRANRNPVKVYSLRALSATQASAEKPDDEECCPPLAA